MTVEIEYQMPHGLNGLGEWQISMARQIEDNQGFPIEEINRTLTNSGRTLVISVETSLPSEAVDNMLSDIEEYLPETAMHIETREV